MDKVDSAIPLSDKNVSDILTQCKELMKQKAIIQDRVKDY